MNTFSNTFCSIGRKVFALLLLAGAASFALAASPVRHHRPDGRLGRPVEALRAPQRVAHDVVILSENFNLFTAGSEAAPDEHDLCEEKRDWCIDPALLQTPGWNGGGIYQAGGCAMVYAYLNDFDGQYYLGYLESPRFDTTESRGEFVVCFRARSVLEQDWLGVCGVPTNHSEAKQKFAVIGQEWGYYEVTLQCGDDNTCVQFEPTSDACFIDDVRIIQVIDDEEPLEERLDTPVVLPVDDYTPEGYTARWKPVAGADDYALYDFLYYTARTDGETFDYINTDFSAITEGSVDAPVNTGGESDFYRYLDDLVGRADWMAYMPMWGGGCLALDNSYATMMPAGLSSPTFRLAAPGSDLNVSLRVMSPTLTTMTLYLYGQKGPLGDYEIPLSPEWTTPCVTIEDCPDGVSFELVVEDMEPDYVFVDDLHVWQTLPAGATAYVAAAYYETDKTQQRVATPNTPAGYRHAFSVSAYQYEFDEEGDVVDYIMSLWTNPAFADGQAPEGLRAITNDVRSHTAGIYDFLGRRAGASARLRMEDGRKVIR